MLAEAEQDFIVPENVQALIWHELVPGLVSSATLPRWWGVTPNELHAAALYQRTGEELLVASAKDAKLRSNVMTILSERMVPQRSEQLEKALERGDTTEALSRVMPGETFYLAAEFRHRFPGESSTLLRKSRRGTGKLVQSFSRRSQLEAIVGRLWRSPSGVGAKLQSRIAEREALSRFHGGYSSRLLAHGGRGILKACTGPGWRMNSSVIPR